MENEKRLIEALTKVATQRGQAYGQFRVTPEYYVSIGVAIGANGILYTVNGSQHTNNEQVAILLVSAAINGRVRA